MFTGLFAAVFGAGILRMNGFSPGRSFHQPLVGVGAAGTIAVCGIGAMLYPLFP
jgi:hypothetical protein